MGRHHDKHQSHVEQDSAPTDQGVKLSRKDYEKEMKKLQIELVLLQQWVVKTGAKICVIFEGRDGAGKGGAIRRITERVSPRVFRVVDFGHDLSFHDHDERFFRL